MLPEHEVRKRLVDLWVEKAVQDLQAAEALAQHDPPLAYPVCFHCQQASEKYLKAYLTYHQVEFSKTHDIGELLELAATVDDKLAEELRPASILTPYGVEARYPGNLPTPSDDDIQETLGLARRVDDAVAERMRWG